ncbi:MAG: hypothetical protein ACXVAX_10585, partial [Pseudobdellovibrio sp.]
MIVACIWLLKPYSTQKVAEVCLRFSPQICVRENEAVFIEIGKSKKLYSTDGFIARIKVLLRRLDVTASISLGQDITEALVRAKYQVHTTEQLPLKALIEFADPFNKDPVAQKYIHKMITAFDSLGITDFESFTKLPASDLVSRFGPIALLCKQRLNFETAIIWPYWKPLEVISEKTEFPYFEFYGELEPILFELKKHLDQIFQRLWARGLKAQKMTVKIYFETNSLNPNPFRQFNFEFLFAQSNTKGALNIIKERLARDFERKPITTPLEGLETTVTGTVKGHVGQKNLLHRHEEITEQRQALLGQLIEAHGHGNIFHVALTEDRRPEKSWIKVETPVASAHVALEKLPLRPTHLIRPEP